MYEPTHFIVNDRAALHKVIVDHPLGLLISVGGDGPVANAVPFVLDPEARPHGRLRVHVARANAQWRMLVEDPSVLVVFQGVERYISPSLYRSKQEHGKVVPTWNYVMVQARGRATVHEEAAWLRPQIEQLTRTNERHRAAPWAVSDAPPDFVAAQMRAIVGIEIAITDLRGKFKVSQNRPAQDRETVLQALDASGEDTDHVMAKLLRATAGS